MSKAKADYLALNAEIQASFERGESEGLEVKLERLAELDVQVKREAELREGFDRINSLVIPDGTHSIARNDEYTIADLLRAEVEGSGHFNVLNRANTVLSDLAATAPTVIGGFVDFALQNAKVVQSLNSLPFQEGASWYRTYHTELNGASAQASEFDTFTSWALESAKRLVTPTTHGAYTPVSVQAIEMGTPSAYALAQADLQKSLVRKMEFVAAAALESAATNTQTLSLTATGAQLIAALINATAQAENNGVENPNTLYMSPDRFAYYATLTASDGRPYFPTLNPTNAAGTASINQLAIPGISNVVVSPRFSTNFMALADPSVLEWYFKPRGIKVEPENVTNGSVNVGISAYVAHCFWSQGIVKFTV